MKRNSRQFMCCSIFVICMVLSSCGIKMNDSNVAENDTTFSWNDTGTMIDSDSSDPMDRVESDTTEITMTTLCVHVCGCVRHPGLYEMPAGSRIGNAIDEAGGFTDSASQESVNLAALLEDGMQIYVPSEDECEEGSDVSHTFHQSSDGSGLINLNTASVDDLMKLNGIGQAKAEAIIEYRETNGVFASIEDIKKVSGIGDSTYENIKNDITV